MPIKPFLRTLSLAFFLLAATRPQAQTEPPFWNDILAFKKADSAAKAPEHPILLIGSSSFTRWTDVQAAFPGYPILNRAFGGSTLKDVIRYSYDVVLPYHPKQVLIYCGENDLASADSISAEEVLLRVKTLFAILRTNLPDAQLSYVSIKPSPVRASIQPKVRAANRLIRKFIRRQRNAAFIDIYDAMLDANGTMREDLYVGDRLHMKPEGYTIWQRIIAPYLRP
ncbi:GDSL-type esterase/lipase family protein [Flaviaesturariibacter aridisoli]|uniref:G-D-S-L family lipolytic protein n=1 Tax=Flaviaesturariibacter aridisoli TaxID=2545761 RepID=A0A4V2WMI6_9BACT|nr:GDSL-type esterase/lipase family protein [Flaviaesturariibacter aridisoli]TCZ69602.1 G-D-S-L family lipolytic protein [Flaviaesturariibacter aridisoli]